MPLKDITREGVTLALEEYQQLGPDGFFDLYRFKDATKYCVLWHGRKYPSKGIAGVAHKHVDGKPMLGSDRFHGGRKVADKLRQLGFEIVVIS